MGKRIVTAVKQRFSIRKLSIGAASVLLGTSLYFMGASAPVVHAVTTGAPAAPEKEKTGTNDPVYVAKDSTKNDADVNNAIDKYAEYALEHDLKNKDNKVIIRPSDKQPVKVNTIKDRVNQVNNIQNDIQTKIKKANQGWDAINTCKKSNNHEIIDGKDSSYFENQSLSVDDEKDSEINQITVTDGSKTKNVNTKLVDRKSKNIDGLVDGQSKNIDGYGINITHTSYITDKEKYTMKVNSNNKVIVDFQDNQCKGKEITVTYDNLNNSYYLENKTNRIKISRIDRTFSSIIQADNSHLFNPNGKDTYKNDAIYDECREPQLIIYNDPSDGFFYNNIKQISVKDTYYYDDKGEQKPIDIKNPAWVFVTSLNSNPSGNIEKVRALRPDNSPVPVNAEKIAGSTVTDHNDGWCYSNINNNFSNNANNIFGQKLDWDNNDEYNRFGFVGTVAFQYHPGMTLQYRADDSQWGSHWACMQTQVVSSLNENVIIYGHIKDSTENVTRNDTVTRTIHYLYDNSNTAQPDKTQTVSFNETGTKDDVTGETTWSNDNAQTVDNVNTPSIVGYTPDKSSIEKQAFKFGDKDVEVTVTYNPDQQKAKVLFIDDTTKNTLDTHNLTGVTNGHESYNPSEEINQFVDKHYVLVSSDYPDNGFTYDNDNSKDQVFEVHLKHGTHDISDKKSITETVTYKMSDGSKAPDKVEKQVEFSRDGYNDEVTKQDHWNKWQPNKQSFSAVPTPDVTGYTPDIKLVEAKTVTSGDKDITVTVTYNPDQQKAKVLFIDDTAKTTLDTHNLTGVTNSHENYNPSEEIGKFVDKHYVLVPSDNPEKDYPEKGFTYDNNDDQDQVFEIHFVHGTHAISEKKSITETITYTMSDGSTAPDKVERKVEFNRVGKHDDVTNTDTWDEWQPNKQSFDVVPTPEVKGYTPDTNSVGAKTVTAGDKDITETVTYTPNKQKAKVVFIDDTDKTTLDTHNLTGVTNSHESYNPSEEIGKFVDKHYVLVPSDNPEKDYPEKGFTYDNNDDQDQVFEIHFVHGTHAISEKKSITETITYTMSDGSTAPDKVERKVEFNRVGKHDDVTNTDTWDEWQPNKQSFDVVPTPEVKGYTPDTNSVEDKTVTAGDNDINITITYTPNKQKAKVVFIDDTDKKTLDTHNLTGVTNSHENYSPSDEIDKFVHENYVLVSSDYPEKGFTYDNDDSQDQEFEVHLKHGITTVTPDNPGKPGEPVDPDNPDGPKYPDGTDEYQVKRTGTQTIHYVGAGDKTPADNKQTFIFTREITFDDVTGKIISVTPWNVQSHTFGNVDTPVIPGYHADKAVAGGETVTSDDLNKVITVTYAPDGNPGNPSDHGDTPSPEPTPEPNPTPDDQPDSEASSDEHFENVKPKDKLDKTNPKKVDAYKKQRKIIKTKIAKQGHTGIEEPIEDKVTRENNVKAVSDPVENTAAEPKLPQTSEADNSIIGLLGMLLASFAAMFGFDSLHSHDKKHKN